jgi:NAD(P)-dependent dehydrogenase (short-subunit alcohol dehydrogenase family)
MASRGWGRVLNIASLQSYRAFANSAPYGAGKGGVVQLIRAIAERPIPPTRIRDKVARLSG